jgi:rhomboid family GlyGly-CTERM serine protease
MRVSLAVVLLCVMLFLLPDRLQGALAFDREAFLAGEIWRLWSGHFVHFSPRHAALDLAILWLVSGIVEREWGVEATVLLYALAPALISLGLLGLVGNLHVYRGSSSLAALFGVAAAMSLWTRDSQVRPVIFGLAMVAVFKCVADACSTRHDATGVVVAWQAHVIGGVLGAMLGSRTMGRCLRTFSDRDGGADVSAPRCGARSS